MSAKFAIITTWLRVGPAQSLARARKGNACTYCRSAVTAKGVPAYKPQAGLQTEKVRIGARLRASYEVMASCHFTKKNYYTLYALTKNERREENGFYRALLSFGVATREEGN